MRSREGSIQNLECSKNQPNLLSESQGTKEFHSKDVYSKMGNIKLSSQSKDNLSFAPMLNEKSINSMNSSNYESEKGEVFRFEYQIENQKVPQSIKSYHPLVRRSPDNSLRERKKNDVRSLKLKGKHSKKGHRIKAKQRTQGKNDLEPIPSESSREYNFIEKMNDSNLENLANQQINIKSIVELTTGNVIQLLKNNPSLLSQIVQNSDQNKNTSPQRNFEKNVKINQRNKQISEMVIDQIKKDSEMEQFIRPNNDSACLKKNSFIEENIINLKDNIDPNQKYYNNTVTKGDNKINNKVLNHEDENKRKVVTVRQPKIRGRLSSKPVKSMIESQGMLEMKNMIHNVHKESEKFENTEDLQNFIKTQSFLETNEVRKINKSEISTNLTKSFNKILNFERNKNLTNEIILSKKERGINISKELGIAPENLNFKKKNSNKKNNIKNQFPIVQQIKNCLNMNQSLNPENAIIGIHSSNLKGQKKMFRTLQPSTSKINQNQNLFLKKKKKKIVRGKFSNKSYNYKSELDTIFKNHMNDTKQNRFFRAFLRSKSPSKREKSQSFIDKKKKPKKFNKSVDTTLKMKKEISNHKVKNKNPKIKKETKIGNKDKKKMKNFNKHKGSNTNNNLKLNEEAQFIYKTLNSRRYKVTIPPKLSNYFYLYIFSNTKSLYFDF